MDYLDSVLETIKPILKNYCFKKQRLNWYTEDKIIIKTFNIQKSLYSKKVYLNIGIFIKNPQIKNEYLSYKCDIQQRLDHLIDEKFLDFENTVDDIQRKAEFDKLLKSNPYNLFTLKSTTEEILEFIENSEPIGPKDNLKALVFKKLNIT